MEVFGLFSTPEHQFYSELRPVLQPQTFSGELHDAQYHAFYHRVILNWLREYSYQHTHLYIQQLEFVTYTSSSILYACRFSSACNTWLMSCNRFETISLFFHLVTVRQEEEKKDHPLRKVLPLHSHMKEKCFELYQPFAHLSIDECMVKSKARSHFRQYIRNKPTKWDNRIHIRLVLCCTTMSANLLEWLIFWCCNAACAAIHVSRIRSLHGQLQHQPQSWCRIALNWNVLTGTLNTSRHGVPPEVLQLKAALKHSSVPRETGYYFHGKDPPIVYICWCHPDIHSVPWTWGWHCQTKSKGLHGTKCYCDGSENSYCSWLHDVPRSCNCQVGS